ncbi:hypothetical protein [Ancylobacter sp. IITR112]|uniref:hypothetical protein n=1 Tax=Ancylobacter sp. IITR112 TaxID=3138073 RepID=UPI00352A3CCA
MNKIVDNYPVERLPADLREGLERTGRVRLIIEAVSPPDASDERLKELLELAGRVSPIGDDPVARIRKLRDEWD